jgi:hypothetical protein
MNPDRNRSDDTPSEAIVGMPPDTGEGSPAELPERAAAHTAVSSGYPAEKARQGEIILRTRTRRIIFFGGLIGLALLIVFMRFAA